MTVPTAKEKKYDRQLRLWGPSGQQALEEAHVLLVNTGPGVVGAETLKNLILPGIGKFTILDHETVTEEDLGANFFVTDDHVGRSRAENLCQCLNELNPDVVGAWSTKALDQYLTPEMGVTMVILTEPMTAPTRSFLRKFEDIQVIVVQSVGFYATFDILFPTLYPVSDTHPDPATISDLRLLRPWDELREYGLKKTANLDEMDDHDHGHVPWLLLILHYLELWKQQHNDNIPTMFKERVEFRKFLTKGMRISSSAGMEENYQQAAGAVMKSLNPPTPSADVQSIWAQPAIKNLETNTPNFWLLAHAVYKFYQKHGVLPLPGSVPDMKAQSADYIELQSLYKSKARADVAWVTAKVRELEVGTSRVLISDAEIELFCKNAAHMTYIQGSKTGEVDGEGIDEAEEQRLVEHLRANQPALLLYLAFQAYAKFKTHYSEAPGGHGKDDQDAIVLKGLMHQALQPLTANSRFTPEEIDAILLEGDEIAEEFVRAAGGELHNISSLMGGMVSQEAIKLITRQYVPVNNSCLFDGIKSTVAVLRME